MWILSVALADVLIEPDDGQIHVSHSLQIQGLAEHPDVVVLAFSGKPGSSLSTHRVFTAERDQHQLASGRARSGNIGEAGLYLMSSEDYEAWNTKRGEEVTRQREACERGEGCVHISRFVPDYNAPKAVVSCNLSIPTVTSAPTGSPSKRLDAYRLTTASADSCVLEASTPEITPVPADPAPADDPVPADDPTPPGPGDDNRDCSSSPGVGSFFLGLAMLMLARRSGRREET